VVVPVRVLGGGVREVPPRKNRRRYIILGVAWLASSPPPPCPLPPRHLASGRQVGRGGVGAGRRGCGEGQGEPQGEAAELEGSPEDF
jgi:hypothetical protein